MHLYTVFVFCWNWGQTQLGKARGERLVVLSLLAYYCSKCITLSILQIAILLFNWIYFTFFLVLLPR